MILSELYVNTIETDEYNSSFKEYLYDDYKIIYHEKIESAIPIIIESLKLAENENYLLWEEKASKVLNIKIDYDKNIFLKRYFNENEVSLDESIKLDGYYLPSNNTIYLYVEDCLKDILMKSIEFKTVLMHEYTHYRYIDFIEKNDVDIDEIPAWFIEGMAEYVACKGSYIFVNSEYIGLKNLTSLNNWKNEIKGLPYQQSHFAILKILEDNDISSIRNMTLKTKEVDFYDAFENVMGISFIDFEKKLKLLYKDIESHSAEKINESLDLMEVREMCLEEFFKRNPDNALACEVLSDVYERNGEVKKAIEVLEVATEKNMESIVLWNKLGLLYEKVGEEKLAKNCFDKEQELKNKDNFYN